MRTRILALLCLLSGPVAALEVAADKVDITPDLARYKIYMAGFGATGRKPKGVHDPLYARILVQRQDGKTVAIVGLDLLGFYHNDVEDLRRRSGFDAPGRYLFVASTHEHSGPDTLALWGPIIGVSGVNRTYHDEIKAKVAARLRELSARLQDAALSGFSAEIDPRGLCRDSRNPTVINPNLAALKFSSRRGTIATIVNWSCHPEVLGPNNRLITADYPGPLCRRIEEKFGGVCVFLNGTIGGLMTPDTEGHAEDFSEAARIGVAVAGKAIQGLAHPTVSARDPKLDYRSERVLIPIENSRYLAFLPALAFGHQLLDSSGRPLPAWKKYWLPLKHALVGLSEKDRPWVESEVSRVDLGPARFIGIPGEIFPELVIGGYDGKYAAGHPLIDPRNPNPPDLSRAPKGPYLIDYVQAPLKIVVGLANDELGYIVPNYDFKVQSTLTMLPRLPGHHYEETNSIGPSVTSIISAAVVRLNQKEKAGPEAGLPKKLLTR